MAMDKVKKEGGHFIWYALIIGVAVGIVAPLMAMLFSYVKGKVSGGSTGAAPSTGA